MQNDVVQTPKTIAIDTYVYDALAKDCFSNDESRRKRFEEFVEALSRAGYVPFISLHHIQEMLQHDNEEKVRNRVNLLARFPMVAWCNPLNRPEFCGGSII